MVKYEYFQLNLLMKNQNKSAKGNHLVIYNAVIDFDFRNYTAINTFIFNKELLKLLKDIIIENNANSLLYM